jgi:uncharacterized protein (DUF4415 family)
MAKKSSASSRQEKLISVKAEDILGKPLRPAQKRMLRRLKQMPDSEIDYSDIPPLTDEQLASARRPAKKLVAVRLDAEILDWLQQHGEGYSTRINSILRAVMTHQRAGSETSLASRRRPRQSEH